MEWLVLVRLVLLLCVSTGFVVLVRRLPTSRVRGIPYVTVGFGLILVNLAVGTVFHSTLFSDEFQMKVLPILGWWTGLVGQTAGLVLLLVGTYMAIRSLLPQISEHYSSLVERSLMGVYLIQDGVFRFVNPRLADLFGYAREDLIGKSVFDLVAPESRDTVRENIRRRVSGETEALQYEFVGLRKNGDRFHVEVYGNRTLYQGRPAVHGTLLDISWRYIAEDDLRKSEERYRTFLQQSSEGIYRLELDRPIPVQAPVEEQLRLLYRHASVAEANHVMAALEGRSDEQELVGMRLEEFLPCRSENDQYLRDWIKAGYRLIDYETVYCDPSGRCRHFLNSPLGIVEDGRLIRVWGTRREITRAKEAEEALRQSEERFRGLFENALTANFISSPDGTILACNDSFARLFGCRNVEEALRMRAEDVYPNAHDRKRFLESLREKRELEQYETVYIRRDGRPVFVVENDVGVFDAAGHLVQIQGSLLDITDKRQIEEQLRQAQKMEALGILAGGIAHDFNNLLTVINTNLFLAELSLYQGHPAIDALNEIKSTVKRAIALTGQILAFGRKQVLEMKSYEVDRIVQEFTGTLRRIIEEDIALEVKTQCGVMVRCDRSQIEQILLNLCVNARDAMSKGGAITVSTKLAAFDESFCRERPWARSGEYACIEVSDTGIGIPQDILSRIFDPFFTTKDVGKGSGMGLAVVYGIARAHQGFIHVESQVGSGSRFYVYIPVAAREHPESVASERSLVTTAGGHETILVVEDNNQIRDITAKILMDHGYMILTASNGEEAVGIMKNSEQPIDLVFTDLVMPRMGGREVYEAAVHIRPDIKFLFTSGYTHVTKDLDFIKKNGFHFLQKPYDVADLLASIRIQLEPRPS